MITDDDIVDRVVDDMINEKADEVVAATMGFDTFGSKPGQHTRNQPHDHDAERLAGLGDGEFDGEIIGRISLCLFLHPWFEHSPSDESLVSTCTSFIFWVVTMQKEVG